MANDSEVQNTMRVTQIRIDPRGLGYIGERLTVQIPIEHQGNLTVAQQYACGVFYKANNWLPDSNKRELANLEARISSSVLRTPQGNDGVTDKKAYNAFLQGACVSVLPWGYFAEKPQDKSIINVPKDTEFVDTINSRIRNNGWGQVGVNGFIPLDFMVDMNTQYRFFVENLARVRQFGDETKIAAFRAYEGLKSRGYLTELNALFTGQKIVVQGSDLNGHKLANVVDILSNTIALNPPDLNQIILDYYESRKGKQREPLATTANSRLFNPAGHNEAGQSGVDATARKVMHNPE